VGRLFIGLFETVFSVVLGILQSLNPASSRLTTFLFLPSHLVFQLVTFDLEIAFVQALCKKTDVG
jgi:hypothetical protein